jgi:hypothetical protein
LATGLPARAMMISSPSWAWVTSFDRLDFASCMFTMCVMGMTLSYLG